MWQYGVILPVDSLARKEGGVLARNPDDSRCSASSLQKKVFLAAASFPDGTFKLASATNCEEKNM